MPGSATAAFPPRRLRGRGPAAKGGPQWLAAGSGTPVPPAGGRRRAARRAPRRFRQTPAVKATATPTPARPPPPPPAGERRPRLRRAPPRGRRRGGLEGEGLRGQRHFVSPLPPPPPPLLSPPLLSHTHTLHTLPSRALARSPCRAPPPPQVPLPAPAAPRRAGAGRAEEGGGVPGREGAAASRRGLAPPPGARGPLRRPRAPPSAAVGSLRGWRREGGNSWCLAGPERFPGQGPAGMGLNSALVRKVGKTQKRGLADADSCLLPCFTVIIARMRPLASRTEARRSVLKRRPARGTRSFARLSARWVAEAGGAEPGPAAGVRFSGSGDPPMATRRSPQPHRWPRGSWNRRLGLFTT